MTNQYMYKSMLQLVDERCTQLRASNSSAETLYLKCLALICVSNLRHFLRDKSELEIYKLTKDIRSLSKMRAEQRHILSRLILEYI